LNILERAIDKIINIVDDNLPTQGMYVEKLEQKSSKTPKSIVIPLSVIQTVANFLWTVNEKVLQRKAKIPGILIPARLNARFKPLKYSNQQAKDILGWQPRYSLEQALERIYSNIDLLAVE